MMHTRRADMVYRAAEKILYEQTGAKLRAAFPHTLPILTGFLFLGMSYGAYARISGLSFWYPVGMSIAVFGGSLEFLAVSMLTGTFALLQTLLTALIFQARHLFYGITMLKKYRGVGKKEGLSHLCVVRCNLFRQLHGHLAQKAWIGAGLPSL